MTTSKSFNATCTGDDEKDDGATTNTLAALGGSLAAPVTVKYNGPQFVEPGQTAVPFGIDMSLALDAKTVDTVAAISPSLTVSGVNAPLTVSGPTATTKINATIPAQTLTLTAGKPFTASFPTIKGQLDEIGNSGLIKITTSSLTFSIKLTSGPLKAPLNLKCSTGATIASIPVKVAGSPDIVQPIEVDAVEGQPVTVDVLGEHVTNGKTKDGVEQQVDPSTLKVVDGDAQIVDGKVVATGPAAGTTADVTFEVCAGTIKIADADPGTSEVQEVRLFHDPDSQALKREIGSRFAFDGESGNQVVWSTDFPMPNPPKDEEVPEGQESWWQKLVGDNFLGFLLIDHTYPTAAEMQAGLESIPTIGAGNVKVTQGEHVSNGAGNVPEDVTLKGSMGYMPYTVEFTGDLANKALDQISVAYLYSFLPSEIKTALLGLADSLGGDDEGEPGDGEPGEEPTPIPDGLTAKEYVDQLFALAGQYGTNGDGEKWFETLQLALKVMGENIA
ncbi:MAG: hypothetical protein KDB20_13095, partial [Microthrixaceae bacterium]|nr:hypothetical protein [Microthrixaceae bacterium]